MSKELEVTFTCTFNKIDNNPTEASYLYVSPTGEEVRIDPPPTAEAYLVVNWVSGDQTGYQVVYV